MKISELVRRLKALGCYLVENRANHDWWYSPITDRHFAVPRHGAKELPVGTLKSIAKQAGVSL